MLVFLDEAGLDNNEVYPYGWSKKGDRLHDTKPGEVTQRISMISALNDNNLSATLVFEGYTNSAVFITYLTAVLVPTLKKGQTVILDNASYHKSPSVKQIIEAAGCFLKYLPPYSPDLNPIEHYWHSKKNSLRKNLKSCEYDLFQAAQLTFNSIGQS
jgi:transposase